MEFGGDMSEAFNVMLQGCEKQLLLLSVQNFIAY
jgi:hypothetical protein